MRLLSNATPRVNRRSVALNIIAGATIWALSQRPSWHLFSRPRITVSTATSAAIDLINEAAPQVVANSVTPRLTNGEMSVLLSSGTVLATKSGQLHVDINGASLMMTLPSAGIARLEHSTENITFSNGDGSTTSVFADEGNSVTAITTIRDSASPTEFSYDYSGIDEI